MNSECNRIRSQFSDYLDGAVTGGVMQKIAHHLETCEGCEREFSEWRNAQSLMGMIGPAKVPKDLGLRLRVAISQESAQSVRQRLDRWHVRWQNTLRPLVLQASAGLASTVLLLGTVSLLIGMFASPEPLAARDEPLGMASSPRFLYTSFEPADAIGDQNNPLIVEAFINGGGRVYDYKIVSGPVDPQTRSELLSTLLFSVFAPARTFGQPVSGMVVLSFSGVAVHG